MRHASRWARRGSVPRTFCACRRTVGERAKLRIHDWTIKADIAQIEAVRRAVGEEFTLLVDANQAQLPGTLQPDPGPVWSYERALNTARELERLGVYWLEEPLDRYDFDNLTRLAAAVDILIAGGENNCGLHEYRWLIERNCYDVLQPEAMVGETMSQIRKACALAEIHHKLCAPHHGGGGLGFVAHLHLCAAIPNCPFVEVFHDPPGFSSEIFQWYLAEPIRLDPADGCMALPQQAGPGCRARRGQGSALRSRSVSLGACVEWAFGVLDYAGHDDGF